MTRRAVGFGPGLVSAASDADPTTVASLAVVGAVTGYALSWLVLLLLPMIAVVQSIAAAIGAICSDEHPRRDPATLRPDVGVAGARRRLGS